MPFKENYPQNNRNYANSKIMRRNVDYRQLPKEEQEEIEKRIVTAPPGGIFQRIIEANAGVDKPEKELTEAESLIARVGTGDIYFNDLPEPIQKEILAQLPVEIQRMTLTKEFSFKHCLVLLEKYAKNSVLAFHVSDDKLKLGDEIKPKAKIGKHRNEDNNVYFSTDLKSLFLPTKFHYLYAFKISPYLAEKSRYGADPSFGRLETQSNDRFRVEDAIELNQETLKELGAEFSKYQAAGRPNIADL